MSLGFEWALQRGFSTSSERTCCFASRTVRPNPWRSDVITDWCERSRQWFIPARHMSHTWAFASHSECEGVERWRAPCYTDHIPKRWFPKPLVLLVPLLPFVKTFNHAFIYPSLPYGFFWCGVGTMRFMFLSNASVCDILEE